MERQKKKDNDAKEEKRKKRVEREKKKRNRPKQTFFQALLADLLPQHDWFTLSTLLLAGALVGIGTVFLLEIELRKFRASQEAYETIMQEAPEEGQKRLVPRNDS